MTTYLSSLSTWTELLKKKVKIKIEKIQFQSKIFNSWLFILKKKFFLQLFEKEISTFQHFLSIFERFF